MDLRGWFSFKKHAALEEHEEPIAIEEREAASKYYALNDLDRKLREHISYRDGFFIELGANNGVNQSNTFHFEKELGWRGVLIEPIPHRFIECVQNRAPENKFFCNACVDKHYNQEFVKIIYSDLMSVAPSLDLDLETKPEQHAQIGVQFLQPGGQTFTFGAVARTLTSILDEACAPQCVDLLSLDVEGAEFDVLKGLDFDRYSFSHIVIESRKFDRIKSFMERKGYVTRDRLSDHDYYLVKSSSI